MNKKKWLVVFILLGFVFCFDVQEVYCSIILKTMVVNPSKTKTQKAILKGFLPKEVKPEDVLNLGDLKIDYDVDKGLYYVYKEVVLEPGESVAREVEIKDIWVIPESELVSLSGRTKEIVEKLRDSNYLEEAVSLSKDVDNKQADIVKEQRQAIDALPQTHIAVYRDNVEKLGQIKDNISRLEKMFLEYKLAKARSAEKVSVKTSWGIILAVIAGLGLLSFIFFIIWHKQAGVLKSPLHKEEEDLSDSE